MTVTRVGIVGASGFLGRHLYARLAADDGYRVTAFDLSRHPSIPTRDFREIDVRRPRSLGSSFDGIDVLFYRAGLKGPARSFERPVRFQQVNVQGLLNVAVECLHAGVGQLVFDSTESVFGPSDEAPFGEGQPPSPNSVYGATKRAAEEYLARLAVDSPLATVVVRYPRVVAGDDESVITRLARSIAGGETVTITASGRKKFDLVHLRDVLRWNRWCTEHRDWSGTLHVSCGEAFTAPEIARAVADEIGRPLRMQITDQRSENDRLLPDHAELDAARSRRRTGLDPEVTGLEELVRTVLSGSAGKER